MESSHSNLVPNKGDSISFINSTPPDFEFEPLDNAPTNPVSKLLELSHKSLAKGLRSNRAVNVGLLGLSFLLYNAYLITAIAYHIRNKTDFAWCEGLGFLIVLTGLTYLGLVYYYVIKGQFGKAISEKVISPLSTMLDPIFSLWYFQVGLGALVFVAFLVFVILDTKDDRRRLISTLGLFILVLIGVVLSKHPGRIRWRHVFWGLGLQFIFGLLILRWETGGNILKCISDKVTIFLNFTTAGSGFVYGYLAVGTAYELKDGQKIELPAVFAFQALSGIFFFSFVVSILYHFGTMTWIVTKLGWLLEVTVGTTAAESMNAAANIFLGMTESPLVVKPYLSKMTNSELHAVMTGGFATIAGSVLGAYISFGIDAFHLLSASVMSAPAALAFAKILYPETQKSITNSKEIYSLRPKKEGNALDAAARGASQAVYLVANIIASLIAVTAFVAMLNTIIHWLGVLVGQDELSFEWIVAKIFTPLAWIIGVDTEEIDTVARLLGLKTVVNEFVAYAALTKECLSPRSVTLATYALCCFANFSSIGITLGGLAAICPERSRDLAKVVFSSFIGGNAAALLTACVAGTLSTDMGYAEWSKTYNCSDPLVST